MEQGKYENVVAELKSGKVVCLIFEDDIVLACNACDSNAFKQMLVTKENSCVVLLADESMLMRYLRKVPEQAFELIEASERPVTIVYDYPQGIAPEFNWAENKIAMQVNSNHDMNKLIHKLHKPIAVCLLEGKPSNYTNYDVLQLNSRLNFVAASVIQLNDSGVFKILKK